MTSILFFTEPPATLGSPSETTSDLHLDEVITAIVGPRAEFDLSPLFYTPLASAAEVRFRQDVFRDLDRPPIRAALEEFTEHMRAVRRRLTGLTKLHSDWQRQGWFLDAACRYTDAVDAITVALHDTNPTSAGLRAVADHLSSLTRSGGYRQLRGDVAQVRDQVRRLRYGLTIAGNTVTVRRDAGEADYSTGVVAAFERFRQRDRVPPAPLKSVTTYMNHVDARILDLTAQLHPAEFGALDTFCRTHAGFVEPGVAQFEREIQFFLATKDFLARLTAADLPTCYPEVADDDPTLDAASVFDIALAAARLQQRKPVVLNDMALCGSDRIIVVTGPNQGGKTTFARTFGQLHHLAALGCPVPGTQVQLGLFDHIETNFERAEDLRTLSGKLEDELLRVRRIIDGATSRTIVIMNETFSSTSLADATVLGASILRQLVDRDLRAVYVTFVDELSRFGPTVVSMVSTVDEDDPSVRTLRVVRRAADGRAYAAALAEKHGLTARQLIERFSA